MNGSVTSGVGHSEALAVPRGLSSASLHEAAGRTGALPSAIKPVGPDMWLAGQAFPVRTPPGDNLWLHRAIYAAQAGEVLVIDTGGGFEYGYWGEILVEAARARDLAGLVIHGGIRDSARLIEIGWPVFAERVSIRGTGKNPRGDGELAEPVTIGEVTISLGDLVVADADGVVCVPAASAKEHVRLAQERDHKEQQVIARLRSGESTMGIYDLPTGHRARLAPGAG